MPATGSARGKPGRHTDNDQGLDWSPRSVKTMKISNFVSPDDVFVKVKASTKKQVLEEMVRLAAMRLDSIDQRAVHDLLTERERLGCTGIGNGIAIPHTRCPMPGDRTTPFTILAVLDQPINFDANDGVPVDIVFMLLAPENCGGEHLTVLALASRLLTAGDTAAALRKATSSQEAWSIIVAGDDEKTAA